MNREHPNPIRHVMSVDVEDYFQTEAFSDSVPRSTWNSYPLRVERNMHRILDLFSVHDVEATFFFVGWIADRYPQLVREVVARGHEVGCHSYWHRPIYRLSPDAFRQDTRMALWAIEDAGGVPVRGYRAPTWSITGDSLWAIRVLMEEGMLYDSSIYPIHHDLYGIPGAKKIPYAWRSGCSILMEFPPATITIANVTLPAAGGGYLRIFPLAYTQMALRAAEREEQRAVIYFHPWEIDPEQPRMRGSWKSRFRQYTGLNSMENHLVELLSQYRFTSFQKVWQEISMLCPSVRVPEVLTKSSMDVLRDREIMHADGGQYARLS